MREGGEGREDGGEEGVSDGRELERCSDLKQFQRSHFLMLPPPPSFPPLPLYHTTLADELFSSAGIKLVVSMYVPVQE